MASITQADINRFQQELARNDRAGFYLDYYNVTGNKQILTLAQISSFSGFTGQIAAVANAIDALVASNYPSGGVESFSLFIAQNILSEIVQNVNQGGTGILSNATILQVPAATWDSLQLGEYFPGNALAVQSLVTGLYNGDFSYFQANSSNIFTIGTGVSLISGALVFNQDIYQSVGAFFNQILNQNPIQPPGTISVSSADGTVHWQVGLNGNVVYGSVTVPFSAAFPNLSNIGPVTINVVNAAGAIVGTLFVNSNNSDQENFYNPTNNDNLAATEFLSANGTRSIMGNSLTENFAAGQSPIVTIDALGDVRTTFTAPNATTLNEVDLMPSDIRIVKNNTSVDDFLAGEVANVDSAGDIAISAPTTYGNTAAYTQLANGAGGSFTVGRDALALGSGVTSISGSGGIFTFGLTPLASSYADALQWNSNTGYATFNVTANGKTFSSAGGQVNPGETFKLDSTGLSLWNGTQELNATTIDAFGTQNDISYNTGAGAWSSTDWVYNVSGGQTELIYNNKDTSAIYDFLNPTSATQFGQFFKNTNGSGEVLADGQAFTTATGDSANLTQGVAGDANALITTASGATADVDLTTAGIAVIAGGTSIAENLPGSSAAVDNAGDVNFTATISPNNIGLLSVAPNGSSNFRVGGDDLAFLAGDLQSVGVNNGSVVFTLAPIAPGISETDLWNPAVGKDYLTITSNNGQTVETTSPGWIDPGDVLTTGNNSQIVLTNAAGQVLNSTQIFLNGYQADTVFNTGGGNLQSNTNFLSNAGQSVGTSSVYNDGSAAASFAGPNSSYSTNYFLAANGSQTVTYYNSTTGSSFTAVIPNNGGEIAYQISPTVTAAEFQSNVASTLALQVISNFLIKNNLPLSLLSQAFTGASIQAATAGSAAYSFSGNQPLTGGQAFIADYSGTLANLVGGLAGTEAGVAIFNALGFSPQAGAALGGVLGGAATQELTATIANSVFGITQGLGLQTLANGTVVLPDFGDALADAGATVLGTYLGSLLSTRIGPGASIGGVLGGTALGIGAGTATGIGIISTLGLTSTFEAIGAVLGIEVPVVGSIVGGFLGSVIGSIIGGLFGGHPSVGPNAGALINYNPSQGFHVFSSGADNGGDPQVAVNLGNALCSQLNAIVSAVGGAVAGLGTGATYSIGYFKGQYFYAPYITAPVTLPNSYSDPTVDVQSAAFNWIESLQFAGGNSYMVDVFENSHDGDINSLINDLNVAADYARYASNPEMFDVSLALSGSQSQLQTWQSEYARGQQLGLNLVADAKFFNEGLRSNVFITVDNHVMASEYDDNGVFVMNALLQGYGGEAWPVDPGSRIAGLGFDMGATGGYDVLLQASDGGMHFFEFNTNGKMISDLHLTDPVGNVWKQDMSITVIGSGYGFNGQPTYNLFTQDSRGAVYAFGFNNAGRMTFGQQALLDPVGNPWLLPTNYRIMGTGVNFGGTGGHNVFVDTPTGQVFAYEFNGVGVMTFSQQLKDPSGNPWLQGYSTRILGTGTNFSGRGEYNIITQDPAGHTYVNGFAANGTMVYGQQELFDTTGVPLQLDPRSLLIGTTQSLFSANGVGVLLTENADNVIAITQYNVGTGYETSAPLFISANNLPVTFGPDTTFIGAARNLLGAGGADVFLTDPSTLRATILEISTSGQILKDYVNAATVINTGHSYTPAELQSIAAGALPHDPSTLPHLTVPLSNYGLV